MPKDTPRKTRRQSRRSKPTDVDMPVHHQLEPRLRNERIVNEILNTLSLNLHDICVEKGDFSKVLSNVKLIGRGGFGDVYIGNINNSPQFVIKEVVLNQHDHKRIGLNKSINYIHQEYYPEEYKIAMFVNKALYNEECPNFILTYNIAICQNCRASDKTCSTVFVEKASGDLNLLSQILTKELVLSAVQQLMAALFWLHSRFGIYHNDIKKENILIIPGSNQGYTKYTVNGMEYNVKNVGHVFCLNDFGLSKVYKPNFSSEKFFGTRNAQIVVDVMVPFASNSKLPVIWTDGTTSTTNKFTTVDIKPSIPVDLNDTVAFPPFEFYFDIQDLLKTFVGGPSPTQRRPHRKLIDFPLLQQYATDYLVFDKMQAAKYVRADLMLSYLYEGVDSVPRIENTWII